MRKTRRKIIIIPQIRICIYRYDIYDDLINFNDMIKLMKK